MSFDPKLMQAIMSGRKAKQAAKEAETARRRLHVRALLPEIAEIEEELRRDMRRLALAALDGDPERALPPIRQKNEALRARRAALLKNAGLSADYLSAVPDCPLCQDTGFVGSTPCRCLREEYAARQAKELSSLLDTGQNNFLTFRLDYYSDRPRPDTQLSPRENMAYIYKKCRSFAEKFSGAGENLLFFGPPGLGKTFLSGCIADRVAGRGFSVVYDTVIRLMAYFEQEKFGGLDDSGRLGLKRIHACDLLLIDDLGTEMATAFTQSAVYMLVNDRLVRGKPMIVSTNLRPEELSARYGAQTASRLLGEFTVLEFFGEDIRLRRKKTSGGM